MKIDPRFAEKIGAEYELFPLAAPHYAEAQGMAAELILGSTAINSRILEIGCGTGITTRALHTALPATAKIVAVDAEEIMVEQAKALLTEANIEYVVADALEFLRSQEEGSVDAIVTAFCLHNLPPVYRKDVFKEMGRVIGRGGIIVQLDKIAQDDIVEYWKALREQIDAFEVFSDTKYPELHAEWTAHYLDDEAIRLTCSEQRELFELAGCDRRTREVARWRMDAIWIGYKQWSR